MKPFNLEEALQGKPFTNDKGWTVEDWHYFKKLVFPITIHWKETPDCLDRCKESELFMLPEKKKVWIVVYRQSNGTIQSVTFEYEDSLKIWMLHLNGRYLETIEKEYEL